MALLSLKAPRHSVELLRGLQLNSLEEFVRPFVASHLSALHASESQVVSGAAKAVAILSSVTGEDFGPPPPEAGLLA